MRSNFQQIVLQRKSSNLPNDLRNFNEIFRKNMTYDNIKSHKKLGSSLENTVLEKTHGHSHLHDL